MKGTYVFISFAIAASVGCKAPEASKAVAETPAPIPTPSPALSQLKTEGCSVLQTKGVVKIECADGSKSESGVPRLHIRSSDGTDLSDLQFLQSGGSVKMLALNKRSGHVLSYDNSGNITKITRTLFESNDCSGRALAFMGSDFVVKNKYMASEGAAPAGVEAFRVIGYEPLTINFNSQFMDGVCSPWAGSANGSTVVEPAEFDDSDPIAIGLPIEIVFDEAG